MLKLNTLRETILAAVPGYQAKPGEIIVATEGQGQIIATGTDSLSFEMHYRAGVYVLGLTEHVDAVLVPVLAWHKANQHELYANPDTRAKAFAFTAQLLDDTQAIDLYLSLQCSERVLVDVSGQAMTALHATEPLPVGFNAKPEHWTLYLQHPEGDRQKLAEWDGPGLPQAHAFLQRLGITP